MSANQRCWSGHGNARLKSNPLATQSCKFAVAQRSAEFLRRPPHRHVMHGTGEAAEPPSSETDKSLSHALVAPLRTNKTVSFLTIDVAFLGDLEDCREVDPMSLEGSVPNTILLNV